ncbi:hypothetical protein [Reichenbachiella ulvae]|uniref:Ig-like domain-containing protein n=1 Tax=Reichenbachiella ulvae TaxID=2980104 RepID=A0ABT3CSS7_9BACT|nr:hypothetical protein [Reichenbachiella ulvae]MCV9386618.1 hypothetical protein [Reichenbachiella ulvae]
MQLKKLVLVASFIISILLVNCGDSDELNISSNIFNSNPGTKWIYVNDYSDTLTWEFTQIKGIEGLELSELGITQTVTNFSYYSQSGNRILKHAEILPKIKYQIDDPDDLTNLETDTLILYSTPSIEYVFNQEIGYKWNRKVFIANTDRYQEVNVQMEVTGNETIETEAGNYNCNVIEDEFGVTYFVSEHGLIKTETTVSLSDTTFILTQELVEIVL